jgi:hypothetical protein
VCVCVYIYIYFFFLTLGDNKLCLASLWASLFSDILQLSTAVPQPLYPLTEQCGVAVML